MKDFLLNNKKKKLLVIFRGINVQIILIIKKFYLSKIDKFVKMHHKIDRNKFIILITW